MIALKRVGFSLAALLLGVSPLLAQGPPPVTTGLVYHVDANDLDGDGSAEGLSEAGLTGSSVTTWVDKATIDGTQTATQGTSGSQPILQFGQFANGLPVVRFDGNDDFMKSPAFTVPLAQPNQMFIVWKADSTSGIVSIAMDGLNSGSREAIVYESGASTGLSGDAIGLFSGSGSTANYTLDPFASAVYLTALFGNPAPHDLRIDGIDRNGAGATESTDPLDGVTLGSRFAAFSGDLLSLDGFIAELLIYDVPLSNANRDMVEAYLYTKWFVPEPASGTLGLCGIVMLAMIRRRMNRQNRGEQSA